MPLSARLRCRLAAATLFALLPLLLLPAPRASAAAGQVAGGRLDWGIRQSFLTYVTGPIAQGSWSLTGGAATVGGSTFRFHSATGTYDPASGALSAAFSGGVRFTGHPGEGGNALDLSIGRLAVRTAGDGSAGLYADVSSKSKETGKVTTTAQTRFADLSLAGVDLRGASGTVTLSRVPTTLTEAGAKAFGGFYSAGTALDPLTLSVTVRPAAQADAPAPSSTPAAPSGPTSSAPAPGATPSPTAAGRQEFAAGALDWGVRRTFRDYVTGSIAKGRWQPADGAADGGAYFRWIGGTGWYEPGGGALSAAFTGSVRFTGLQDGDALGLDLTLADPAVTVTGGQGRLTVDVRGRTPDGTVQQATGVPIAEFPATALTTDGGLLKAVELPLQLTEAGSKAFGSLYPAGTAMDPLSFAVALVPGTALPPLPDLGSSPTPTSTASAAPSAAPAAPAAAASTGGTAGWWVAAAAALLLPGAAGGALLLRRRRRTAS
ncbi:HtaA domain-containing protein [Kitasatospora sp. NPDC048365]|uniref:HtaA domain-containing protein n=1 Tax=Kitasatospora sp. NPDC048365 TaxID=3364050 RepID=UPI0037184C3F